MKQAVKIVIIIPVYKVEKYLARCVESILTQTFKDYGLILVDDGSPDNCPKMCDEYAAKYDFIKVIHKENGGQGDARNVGLEYAFNSIEFEWICFIDSDDFIHPRCLEILYGAAQKNNLDISSCGYIRKGNFDTIPEDIGQLTVIDSADNLSLYPHDIYNNGVPWGRIYKKYLFENLRFPINRFYEDGFTIYKALFSVDKIVLVNLKLYCWYVNTEGTTSGKASVKKVDDFIDAMADNISFFKKNGFLNAYKHEVETFFYRMIGHMKKFKNNKDWNNVNNKFKKIGRLIIKTDRSNYPYSRNDDVYKTVFSPIYCFVLKVLYRIKKKK